MQAVCGDWCVDVSTVRRWVRRFKDGELGFKNKTPIFFKGGSPKLAQRWRKCIEVRGDFVEK
jgi:transposase